MKNGAMGVADNENKEKENGSSWYKWYVLCLVTTGFVIAELGHYQLGTTTKLMAAELHYGDQSCMMTADLRVSQLPVICEKVDSKEICESLTLNGSRYCEWGYSGFGLDYQILAGPTFMATNTVTGILMGLAGDRYNRARILSACTLIFAVTTVATGAVTAYWHFLVLRMTMAAFQSGCIPLSTSILTDLFPQNQRALALSIFHFGIYVGYGIAFPVGRFTPYLDPDGLSWRLCYIIQGVIGVVIAAVTFVTLRDPEKVAVGEEVEREKKTGKKTNLSIWRLMLQPKMIVFCIAASLRYAGGCAYAYNTDLFYREYYPDVYLGWWLFIIYVGVGSLGVMAGGLVSDRIVGKNGVRSRALVLAVSQLLATPPAYGSLLCGPMWAMITFAISYFFAEWWFGILYAVLVEIIPVSHRSTALGIFVFVMMNIGGNLPVLVDPLTRTIGYMEALLIMYPSLYLVCTILFFICVPMMKAPEEDEDDPDTKEQPV